MIRGIIFSVAFLFCASLYSFPRNKITSASKSGKLEFDVMAVSEKGTEPLNGKEVKMTAYKLIGMGGEMKLLSTTNSKTDSSGKVVFKGLSTDHSNVYVGSVNHKGLDFSSSMINFMEKGKDSIQEQITVYDKTDDDAYISVVNKHMIIKGSEDKNKILITEFNILTNSSSKVFVPTEKNNLKVGVPEGVKNLSFDFGAPQDAISYIEGGDHFSLSIPVYPGHSNMANIGIKYEVHLKGNEFNFKENLYYPVMSAIILLEDKELVISGKGVKESGEKSFGDKVYREFNISGIQGDKSLSFTIERPTLKIEKSKLFILAAILAIIGFAVFASIKWKKDGDS